MTSLTRQSGLTLVELMIASVLGLFLVLGLTQLFVGSSQTFRLAEATARTQEAGRLAHEILGRAVRSADYWGCVKYGGVESVLDADDEDFDESIHGFDPDSQASVEVAVAAESDVAVEGSHIIRLKGADGPAVALDGPMNNSSAILDVTSSAGIEVGDILVLSDCSDGVVFQATHLPGSGDKIQHNTGQNSPGNAKGSCPGGGGGGSANCFPKAFTSGDVHKAYSRQYEVRDDGSGRRGLFMVANNGTHELIDGIRDMRIQVGVGPNATVNQWLDPSDASIDMANIKALRISLLARSPNDEVTAKPQSVCFPAWADCSGGPNWAVGADDRHLYRVYTSTYSIRNRLLEGI